MSLNHPILEASFAIIDQEVAAMSHGLTPDQYAIARRVIHSTADFEYLQLLRFSPGVVSLAIAALRQKTPIITDVTMVKQGIIGLVNRTFGNPVIAAIDLAPMAEPGKTRTETGLLRCWKQYPQAIYAIGNAPTALLALCEQVANHQQSPALIIGAPVGFVSVVESKQVLAGLDLPQIRVEGRKGGSPVVAAIVNALLVLAWQEGTD